MQVKICILDTDYVIDPEGVPVVRLWGVDEKGKSVVVLDRRFRPYFYIQPKPGLGEEEFEDLKKRIMGMELEGSKPERIFEQEKKFLGKPTKVVKVVVTNPSDVPKFRELVKDWVGVKNEFEYGISFYKRYLIDNGLTPMDWTEVTGRIKAGTGPDTDLVLEAENIKPFTSAYPSLRTLVFDLEVAEEGGEEKIIMVSVKDNKGFDKVLTYKNVRAKDVEIVRDEKALIERFLEIVKERNPDIISGYNTDRFDFPKLIERAHKYGVKVLLGRDGEPVVFKRRGRISSATIRGRVHVDLYDFIEHILAQTLKSEVLTLDRVGKELLGVGKKKMEWTDIETIWKEGRGLRKIVEYCRWDSELALRLAEHILPQIFELCRITDQTLFDTSRMTFSQLVEWVLIRRAFEIGEIAYNRPKFDEVQRRRSAEAFTGAYVHEPKGGIHEDIVLFDFMSLYPTIIVSHNISPEMLDCGHRECEKNTAPGEEHYFCTKEKGFIPEILEKIISKRIEVKKKLPEKKTAKYKEMQNRQFALKILANSFYGYYGYAGSRWYSRVCAQSITAWGRYYIKNVIEMAEKAKFDVLYGDTDSLFLRIKRKGDANAFMEKVNRKLPGIMELEFKDVYERGIFIETKTGAIAKKKYALLEKDGDLVMKGMETRRRDWAKIAKDTQEKVLKAILKEKSVKKAVNIVHRTVHSLRRGDVNMDELVIYMQITRPLSEYEQLGPHVKAARKSISRGRPLGEGSTIAYVVTKGTGSISDRAEPAEDAENYDPEYYIYHQVIPSAMRILSGFDIDEDELVKGKMEKVPTLENFLKKRKKKSKKR